MITLPASALSGNESVLLGGFGGKYCARSAARREYIAPASYRRSALEFVTTTQDASMAMPVGKKKRAGSGRSGSGPKGGGSSVGGPGKLQAQRAAARVIEGGGR